MKATSKERLNDKARKMIDLIHDEVIDGGEKSISSSFLDHKNGNRYTLEIKVKVDNPREIPEDLANFIEPDNENQGDDGDL